MLDSTDSSLASIRLGETVRIHTILFDLVREECSRLGVHAGQTVRPVLGSEGYLVLELPHGARVALKRKVTRFIQIEARMPAAMLANVALDTERRTQCASC